MKFKTRAILLTTILSFTLHADQFSFLFYNDFFAGTDKHFTNGMSISWLDNKHDDTNTTQLSAYTKMFIHLKDTLLLAESNNSQHYNAGISIGQVIVTPTNTELETMQYDDMPYAGYLSLDMYLFEISKESFIEYRVEVGIVGEEAGGDFVQNSFHSIVNSDKAQGWDTQLKTEYIVNLLLRYGEISWEKRVSSGISMDWFNQIGTRIGNFSTNIFGGSVFRIGQNYTRNFNLHYPYLKEEAATIIIDTVHDGFAWSTSLGLNSEALFYSYILDEARREGYNIDKNIFNISAYLGTDFCYDLHTLTLFYRLQSPYSKTQSSYDTFGGFSYSYKF